MTGTLRSAGQLHLISLSEAVREWFLDALSVAREIVIAFAGMAVDAVRRGGHR
jgi:hypothetical protein